MGDVPCEIAMYLSLRVDSTVISEGIAHPPEVDVNSYVAERPTGPVVGKKDESRIIDRVQSLWGSPERDRHVLLRCSVGEIASAVVVEANLAEITPIENGAFSEIAADVFPLAQAIRTRDGFARTEGEEDGGVLAQPTVPSSGPTTTERWHRRLWPNSSRRSTSH